MPTYNVSNTGNDSTGDGSIQTPYATINRAITEAVNGDVIEIAAGTYTGNFDVNKVVTINGANAGKQGISNDRAPETVLLNTQSSILANAILDGLKFKHTDNISEALINQSGPTIKNCVFERIANGAGQAARAISTSSDAGNYNITNNLFTGSISGGLFSSHLTWNSGLFLTNVLGKTGIIENNTFSNCRTAINSDDNNSLVILRNNDFSNCGTYISFGGSTPPSAGMQIENNTFSISNTLINNSNVADSFKLNISNNIFKFGDVSLSSQELSLEQKFTIESKMYHKGRSSRKGIVYFSNNEQFVIAGLTTITSALSFAPSTGETIYVGPGTHGSTTITTLTLNKSVKINGANIDVSYKSTRNVETHLLNHKFDILANNVEINGIKVTGSNLAGQTVFGGDNKTFNNLVVKNSIIEDINGMCLYYQGTGVRDGITFSECKVSGIGNGTDGKGTSSAFNPWTCKNVTINNCLIENVDYNGINLESVENATVTNNIIRNIGKSGIQLANNCKGIFVIKNNIFTQINCAYYGWGKINIRNNLVNPVAPRTVSGTSDPDRQFYYAGIKWFSIANPLVHIGSYAIEDNTFDNCWCGYQFARELPSTGGPIISFKNNTLQNNTHGDVMIYRTNSTNALYNLKENGIENASIKVFDWSKTLGNEVDNIEQWSSVLQRGSRNTIVLDKTSPALVQVETGKLITLQNMSINSVLDKAVNGDVIEIAAGTYTGNFDVNKVVTINGANAGKQGISNDRAPETVLLNTQSSILANAILDGLKFKHTDNISEALINQSGPTIKNCVFERIANGAGQAARAISTSSDAGNYNITNNLFTGSISGGLFSSHLTWNSGLFLTNVLGKTGIIENNTFSNCRTAINSDDNNSLVILRNNDFSNCGTYISFGGSTPPSAGMQIENNTFSISNTLINNSNVADSFKLNISNNIFKFGDVSLSSQELSLEQKFTIESKMYHKGRSSRKGIVYFSNNEQFVIAGLTTITSALSFAPSTGETIYVGPGTHTDNVTVNKSVTLLGQDKATTILQPSNTTTTATIQITDGASGTTIKNMTVKGKFATQTTTGTGNSENNNSAILVLNTNTSTNPEINNLLLENLVLRQASNGIAFNNKHSTNINVKDCVIQNNEGSGIRISSNTETMNGFLVDGCTIQNNNLNAINSNASGTYRPNCTNFKISNCTINNNNLLTTNNSHDVSIFGFNGNIEISNTNIICKHAESKSVNGTLSTATFGGWGLIIFGTGSSNENYKPSGNITMLNITITGNVIKSVFGIDRYSTLGNISMNNVNIKDCESNKANLTWLQLSIGHRDQSKSFLLGNTKLKTIYTSNIGNVDAVNANFYDNNTGSLLSSTVNLLEIKKQIYDKTSNLFIGEVIISQNTTIISPVVANSIVNALNSQSQSQSVINYLNLIPGKYTVNEPLVNTSTKPKIITSIESTSVLINI